MIDDTLLSRWMVTRWMWNFKVKCNRLSYPNELFEIPYLLSLLYIYQIDSGKTDYIAQQK